MNVPVFGFLNFAQAANENIFLLLKLLESLDLEGKRGNSQTKGTSTVPSPTV